MTFDPDLINKFQQNLRMAQIHSTQGLSETNIDAVETYLRSALIYLEELDNRKQDGVALTITEHPQGLEAPEDLNEEALVDDLEYDDETKKISKKG